MAIAKIISATGRLKNKIDFSYSVQTDAAGEIITDSGMIYSTDPQMVTSGILLAVSYSGTGSFSKTFENIENGVYYAVAYAHEEGITGNNYYSSPVQITVLDHGYEMSTDGATIADSLSISNGTEGEKKVLVSNSAGVAAWKPIKSLFNYGHYIGELYGGGIVVDVWKEGDDEKVLIASLENLKSTLGYYNPSGSLYASTWVFGGSTTLIGTQSQSLYNGRQNTDAILEFSRSIGATGSAAQVCADYRGGGYDDWYLPSYYELNSIYNSANIVNRVIGGESLYFERNNLAYYTYEPLYLIKSGYWTSTEASATSSYVMDTYFHSNLKTRNYFEGELSPKIRAVRKESIYAAGGLCLSLDAGSIKSFSGSDYPTLGTSSRWTDLVNSGMTSSYSFPLSAYPTAASGGTNVPIIPILSSIAGPGTTFSGTNGSWYLSNITNSDPAMAKLYNNGATSSLTSNYFSVNYSDATLSFQTSDVSSAANPAGATLNVYISVSSPGYNSPYSLIRQVSDNVAGVRTISVPLYSYLGKTISIKITAPNASYTSASIYKGPSVDEIIVSGTSGGYRPIGPVYFPESGGYLKFTGNSYVNFTAPIAGATTVTVEVWARLDAGYSETMLFGWNQYDVYMAGGHLGYNTNSSDLYGVDATKVSSLGLIGNWAHYVFEMRSDVSYTNNKIYINGNLQSLSSKYPGTENSATRNFNNGNGRIGGFLGNNSYLFKGDISIFRVYKRALTKDEIMKNYSMDRARYEILPSAMKNNLKMSFDANLSYSGSGTAIAELSGSHSNGSIASSSGYVSPTYSSSSELYPGKYFEFNGFNTKIEYPPIPLIENMSWEAWIRCAGTVSAPNAQLTGSVNMFMGQVLPYIGFDTNRILFSNYIGGVQTYLRTPSNSVSLNKWYHIVATSETASGKTLTRLYINGAKSSESYESGTQSKYNGLDYNFAIGDGQGTDRNLGAGLVYPTQWYPFKGSVAQARVYNKALSYEEVKNNYAAHRHVYEDDFGDSSRFYSHELNGNPTFSIFQNLTLDIAGRGNDRVLRSDAEGNASWVDKSSLFTRPTNNRYIGEFYGGGIIVAMWKYPYNVSNYLIMSTSDVSQSSAWSNVGSTASNATSEHGGISNSSAIIAQAGHVSSAAKLCDDYAGGGFTDWYLPSITELNQAFNAVQCVDSSLGSDLLKETYWSSTESGRTTAYAYEFRDSAGKKGMIRGDIQKSATASVRAFRHAKVYDVRRYWNPYWEYEYTPIWGGPYAWDDSNWTFSTITLTTGPISFVSFSGSSRTHLVTGSSLSIPAGISVVEFGVCWLGNSYGINGSGPEPGTPTISNSKVVSTGSYSSFNSTITWISTGNYSINARAYAITSAGTYYGQLRNDSYYAWF